MLTKEDLKEKIENNNRSIDIESLENYLKNWRIDPVYEDENGVEYFDDLAIAKLNQGIILKEQERTEEEILYILHKEIKMPVDNPVTVSPSNKTKIQPRKYSNNGKLKNVTVDLTSQTLVMLAESIAQKISDDINIKIKDNDILQSALDSGKLRRDNEILAAQVEKLLEENKKLSSQIGFLLQEKAKFKKAFGSFYIKYE